MAFPVTCPACGKAFQLATEIYERKVAGKIVSIKCKQCQAGIRVDATTPGELKVVGATPAGSGDVSLGPKPPQAPQAKAPSPAAGAERPQPAPVRMRQPTLIGMVNPQVALQKRPAPQPAPAPPPAATKAPVLWAIDSGGAGDDRELDENEIRRELEAGRLTPQTLVWRDGMAEWLAIEKIPELRRFMEKPREVEKPREGPKHAAPRAAERPTPPEVPRAKEQTASFQDDADAENTMVYDRSAPNAALEPFAAPDSDKTVRVMIGDAPPPLPAAGRPAAFAKTVPLADPPPPPLPPAGLPAPPAHPAPPLPAARPLPAAPPMQATPPTPPVETAPPAAHPQAPPPAPAAPALPRLPAQPPVLAAVPWGEPLPSAKPATPGLPTAPYRPDPFAVAATTDLDFPSPRSKKPLVIAVVAVVAAIGIGIAILSSSSPQVANIAAPPPAPLETSPAPTPKAAEPAPTSEPTRNDDSPGTSAPGVQPQTGNGNFSDLFSKGAEKAKGSGSTKGFDEAKAREALAAVLDAAAACKEPGAQMGQTTATVTFESSGAVSGVTVGAPFAGTSTGTCIINAFKRAKTAPFSGLPGTVSQSISIR